MRRVLVFAIVLSVCGGIAVFAMKATQPTALPYALNAAYDLAALRALPESRDMVSIAELRRMDQEAFRLVSRASASEKDAFAFYARLAHLERRYIALSYAVSGAPRGSVVPVAHRVMCETFPDDCVFVWRTLDDHRVFDDSYTIALTDAVMDVARNEPARPSRALSINPVIDDRGSAYEEYVQTLAARTAEQRRASVLWTAGEGTRQAPGILLDLIDGYLALDTQRSVGDFAVARSNLMMRGFEAYTSAYTFATTPPNVYPSVATDTPAFPYMLTAVHVTAPDLARLLAETPQRDLATEVSDVTGAFSNSGTYYPSVVREAVRIAEVLRATGATGDIP